MHREIRNQLLTKTQGAKPKPGLPIYVQKDPTACTYRACSTKQIHHIAKRVGLQTTTQGNTAWVREQEVRIQVALEVHPQPAAEAREAAPVRVPVRDRTKDPAILRTFDVCAVPLEKRLQCAGALVLCAQAFRCSARPLVDCNV